MELTCKFLWSKREKIHTFLSKLNENDKGHQMRPLSLVTMMTLFWVLHIRISVNRVPIRVPVPKHLEPEPDSVVCYPEPEPVVQVPVLKPYICYEFDSEYPNCLLTPNFRY